MVINQIHSIGDILFIEPICRHFWNLNGKKPILPVRDHLMWLSEYIQSAELVPLSTSGMDEDCMDVKEDYLPLRFANQIVRGLQPYDHHDFENMMLDKYELSNVNKHLWRYIYLKFNLTKGSDLMKHINLKHNDKFILINNKSQAGTIDIRPSNPNNYRIVYMEEIPGYTVIDWYLVMYYAQENHHVSTCTFFIMQAIGRYFGEFNSKVFIYPRPNEDGLRGISQLQPSFELTRCE